MPTTRQIDPLRPVLTRWCTRRNSHPSGSGRNDFVDRTRSPALPRVPRQAQPEDMLNMRVLLPQIKRRRQFRARSGGRRCALIWAGAPGTAARYAGTACKNERRVADCARGSFPVPGWPQPKRKRRGSLRAVRACVAGGYFWPGFFGCFGFFGSFFCLSRLPMASPVGCVVGRTLHCGGCRGIYSRTRRNGKGSIGGR
jgi:hypothetical protein